MEDIIQVMDQGTTDVALHVDAPLGKDQNVVYKDVHIGHWHHIPSLEVRVMIKMGQGRLQWQWVEPYHCLQTVVYF